MGCNAFTVLVGEDDLNSFRTVSSLFTLADFSCRHKLLTLKKVSPTNNSLFPLTDIDLLALDEASIWSSSVVLVKQQVEKLPYRAEAHASH